MCGIAGMMGTAINQQDIAMIHDLAYVLGLRGTDSTGVLQGFVHKKNRSYKVIKSAHEVSFYMWWNANMAKEGGDPGILTDITDNFMAVHTRAATRGFITKENAHPFEKSNIIGMHNGTLLESKYDDIIRTDSELMFDDINKRGLMSVLSELKEKSAYAIVMFDKRTNKFSFVRNTERPLCYAINKKRKVFYWASEARMLSFAAGRNFVELECIKVFEPGKIYEFGPHDIRTGKEPLWSFKAVVSQLPLMLPKPIEQDLEDRISFLPRRNIKVSSTPSVPYKHNVVPIDSKPKKRDQRKVVTLNMELCTGCRRELNLYEQWKGHEYEKGKYLCQACDDKTFKNSQKSDNEVIH